MAYLRIARQGSETCRIDPGMEQPHAARRQAPFLKQDSLRVPAISDEAARSLHDAGGHPAQLPTGHDSLPLPARVTLDLLAVDITEVGQSAHLPDQPGDPALG